MCPRSPIVAFGCDNIIERLVYTHKPGLKRKINRDSLGHTHTYTTGMEYGNVCVHLLIPLLALALVLYQRLQEDAVFTTNVDGVDHRLSLSLSLSLSLFSLSLFSLSLSLLSLFSLSLSLLSLSSLSLFSFSLFLSLFLSYFHLSIFISFFRLHQLIFVLYTAHIR